MSKIWKQFFIMILEMNRGMIKNMPEDMRNDSKEKLLDSRINELKTMLENETEVNKADVDFLKLMAEGAQQESKINKEMYTQIENLCIQSLEKMQDESIKTSKDFYNKFND